jgi:quinolinate synthase
MSGVLMTIRADTFEQTYQEMKRKLNHIVPEIELKYKAELAYEINRLKKERGAVILGHNYMEPALYISVPDVVGDSLELARAAAGTTADPIVFCGVRFMAETAKILSPDKMVLLPAKIAGCSLAESITAEDVRELRKKYPGVPVVTYINTYADVKAETDVCCTSGNASKVVQSLDSDVVIFLPDEYLAKNVARETGKKIIFPSKDSKSDKKINEININYELIGWHGKCEVHEQFKVDDIENARKQFPDVTVLSHPECTPEVVEASDYSGSTSRMIKYVKESPSKRFLLLTECSMGDNIIAENPDKEIVRICSIRCPHMNEITLEDTLAALRNDQYQIEVPEDIRLRAKKSIDRMLEIG